jgi:hypothetical protein
MIAGVIYAVVVVFASFDAIPFSGMILKPYRWLYTMIDRILSFF